MKKLIVIVALVAAGLCAKAQLKVANGGNVGFGTNNPLGKIHVDGGALRIGNGTNLIDRTLNVIKIGDGDYVKIGEWEQNNKLSFYSSVGYSFFVGSASGSGGSFRISDWTDIVMDWTGKCCGSPVIYPSSDWYLQLGKEDKRIGTTYTDMLYYNTQYKFSDTRMKENITPLRNPIEKIMQISAYNYNLKEKLYPDQLPPEVKANLTKKQIVFLAQELAQVFPELVNEPTTEKGLYSVNYIDMIPVLVEAIKEQQNQIDNLQKMLSECCYLKNNPTQKSNILDNEEGIINETPKSRLYDNIPNPFSENTEIRFEIPDNATSAQLMICNLNGVELKSYILTQKGFGSVIIQGSEFAAGIYLYTLLINNQIVDTKKMVLTK